MTRKKSRDDATMLDTRRQMIAEHERKKATMKKELLELMKLNGWNQAEFAAAVGVHWSTVYRWLEEDAMPIPIVRAKIKELLTEARARTTVRQTA